MFKKLFSSSTSACFEFDNLNPFFHPGGKYTIFLNGVKAGEADTNVFSLFGLAPDTEYEVGVSCEDCTLRFKTDAETAVVDVRALGAKADGKTDDTYYVQMAIDSCPAGGRVLFTEGSYYVRPIVLKSNITIELKKGAQLLGSVREEDYPYIPARTYNADGSEEILASWEGDPFDCHQSFVSAYRQSNIKIVGEGAINGNADNSTWWATPKGRKVARPRLVFLNKCRNVVFHGVTCKNSASWNLHPFFSKDLAFYDVKVQNPYTGPNTDGLDPESCDKTYKTPANRHTLRNNLFRDGHGAIVLGSEMSGGVTNLTVSQCLFRHTDRGLRIKTRRGRGKDAVIDGVVFENIKMENVITPLVVNMYYFCDPDGHTEFVWSRKPHPVDDGTPYIGSFLFKDIDCEDCECMCGYFDGLVEQPIGSVTLENVHFGFKKDAKPFKPAMLEFVREYCKEGLYIDNVKKVVLKNVTFDGVEGDHIIEKNCGELVIE